MSIYKTGNNKLQFTSNILRNFRDFTYNAVPKKRKKKQNELLKIHQIEINYVLYLSYAVSRFPLASLFESLN